MDTKTIENVWYWHLAGGVGQGEVWDCKKTRWRQKKAEKLNLVDLNQKQGVASQLKLIGKLVLKRLPAI